MVRPDTDVFVFPAQLSFNEPFSLKLELKSLIHMVSSLATSSETKIGLRSDP